MRKVDRILKDAKKKHFIDVSTKEGIKSLIRYCLWIGQAEGYKLGYKLAKQIFKIR